MTGTQGALIVHLARATARKANVANLLRDLPIPAEVLDAVDGRAASPETLAAYDPARALRPRYPFALQPGEIACFLSHRKGWAEIVARGWDWGVLIEDDAAVDPEAFAAALILAQETAGGDGFVQFQTRAPREVSAVATRGAQTLSQPDLAPLRTTCNLFSRAACERLLAVTESFDRPIDVLLQMHWVTGLRPRVVWPSGVTEVSEQVGGTTIQTKGKGFLDHLNREIRRPLFRAAMKRWARRG